MLALSCGFWSATGRWFSVSQPCSCQALRGDVIPSLMALIATFTVYFRHDLPRSRRGNVAAELGGGAVAWRCCD
jgi:hypothetical protein